MRLKTAAISIGLAICPPSVNSFSIHSNEVTSYRNKKATSSSLGVVSTQELPIETGADVETIVAVEVQELSTTAPAPAPALSTTATDNETKQKSNSKVKPNKDIGFLVKRTNQIISGVPLSKSSSSIDARTFHWLIDAWTATHHPSAPEHSLSLLNSMKEYDIEPTQKTLAKVLCAYSKCGRGGDATKMIMDSFSKRIKPNVFMYTAILEAYANDDNRSVSNAVKAQELCEWMTANDIVPNARSFSAVIRAWGKTDAAIGTLEAEQCLENMKRLCDEGVIKDGPNVYHYNSVLKAWAKSQADDSADRAEALLRKMESGNIAHVKPNTISYNTCIDAYAQNGDGENAEALLNRMEELFQTRVNMECKPNTRSYNSVINAYAKSLENNSALKAETFLRKMENIYEESNKEDLDIKPDFFSFSTVINAWARSIEPGKASKVLQLYREMKHSHENGNASLRPNVVVFNSIINACAYTVGDPSEQREAMEIANMMLKELGESTYANADQVTYGTYLKVCQNQLPQSEMRSKIVNAVFKRCIEDGQVGQLVLDQAKGVTTPDQYEELLGDYCTETHWMDLPEEWTRNVVEGKRYRRQQLFS